MFALASPLVLAPVAGAVSPAPAPDVEELLRRLTGSFSSAAQAGADSACFDIRLHAVPIRTNDRSFRWIYLEQAAADRLHAEGRQVWGAEDGPYVFRRVEEAVGRTP